MSQPERSKAFTLFQKDLSESLHLPEWVPMCHPIPVSGIGGQRVGNGDKWNPRRVTLQSRQFVSPVPSLPPTGPPRPTLWEGRHHRRTCHVQESTSRCRFGERELLLSWLRDRVRTNTRHRGVSDPAPTPNSRPEGSPYGIRGTWSRLTYDFGFSFRVIGVVSQSG